MIHSLLARSIRVRKSDMIRDKNRTGNINVLSVMKLQENNSLLLNNVFGGRRQ